MSERSSIFSAKIEGELIGYVKGCKAFDLFGHERCRYDELSGNLCDLTSGKVVGHVSLEGKFVGLSWRADELFPRFDSGPLVGTETDGAESEEPKVSESQSSQYSETHAELPLSELDRQATPASQDSLFSNDVEKVFEMLRTRIGLGA